jgi:hypothetical protein
MVTADKLTFTELDYRVRDLMPRLPDIPDLSHLPPEQVRRGKAFAEWLREILYRTGWNKKRLAEEAGVVTATLTPLFADGYDKQSDKIRRPDEETISKLAKAARRVSKAIEEDAGRMAAGYLPKNPNIFVAPSNQDKTLADRLRTLLLEIESGSTPVAIPPRPSLDEETEEMVEAYEGLPEPLKETVRENIKSLRRATDQTYRTRKDIIGKRSEEDTEGDHGAPFGDEPGE